MKQRSGGTSGLRAILPFDLGIVIKNLSKVKLKGGVVGKATLAIMVVSLCFAIISWSVHSMLISGIALGLTFIFAFILLWRLISFADRHPQAALLEGAEFLAHAQLQLGSKANPVITVEQSDRTQPEPVEGASANPELAAQPDLSAEQINGEEGQ